MSRDVEAPLDGNDRDHALEAIADFAMSTRYETIPSEAIARARDILVDTIACAMGGRGCRAASAANDFASSGKGAEGGPVIGHSGGTSPDLAAFWNTSMIRYLDFNDSGPRGGHPSDMLGSHIALSRRANASGPDLLTAIVIGHEVYNRISDRVLYDDRRLDAGYGVAIGAAAAGSRLLGLSPEATRNAISIAATSSVPIRASRSGQLSDIKGFATALSARDAVFYLLLAEAGLSGPLEPFEGRHGIVELLGGEAGSLGMADFGNWTILGTRLKYWQAAYNTHPAIWAALDLRDKVDVDRIASVTLGVNPRAYHESGSEPEKWSPRTRETADHSLPYLFARAFLDGRVDQESYRPEVLADPAGRALMGKTSVILDPEMAAQRPRLVLGCRAEVVTNDGDTLTSIIDGIPGHESNPLSKDQIANKFHSLAEPILGSSTTAAFERAWAVDAVDDFGKVLEALAPAN